MPTTSPMQPKIMRPISLSRTILKGPKSLGQRTQISMIAGNAIPKAERHRAPNKEMNNPSLGIDIARTTEN